jgi:hypothetical protein
MGIAANIAGIELQVQTEEGKSQGRVPAGNWLAWGFSSCDDPMRFKRVCLTLYMTVNQDT